MRNKLFLPIFHPTCFKNYPILILEPYPNFFWFGAMFTVKILQEMLGSNSARHYPAKFWPEEKTPYLLNLKRRFVSCNFNQLHLKYSWLNFYGWQSIISTKRFHTNMHLMTPVFPNPLILSLKVIDLLLTYHRSR